MGFVILRSEARKDLGFGFVVLNAVRAWFCFVILSAAKDLVLFFL
ncbi:hypothetical protein [Aminivibrio sp.]